MNQVLIHCKPEYLPEVKRLGLNYIHSQNDEIDVTVSDIEYVELIDKNRLDDLLEYSNKEMRANV